MIYCLNRVKREKIKGFRTAGKKAPDDVVLFLSNKGVKEFSFYEPSKEGSVFMRRIKFAFVDLYNWFKLYCAVKRGDTVILQHPYQHSVHTLTFQNAIKRKGVCVVILIHDLLNLRNGIEMHRSTKKKAKQSEAEKRSMAGADYVICHNEKMKAYMVKEMGLEPAKINCLGLFDYAHSCELPENRSLETAVVIAGNLQKTKSEYIYKLIGADKLNCKVHLYGPNFDAAEMRENVVYHGTLPAEELPGKLEGSFGLVWDGQEITTCAGITGEYLRYNNPHKCSLFLASNMPVIIWKEAALASFVEGNGVGLTVDSLLDVESAIAALSEQEYAQILQNTKTIGKKIREGEYLTAAIKEIMAGC